MKILLIGATGMIGSRILAEALARGHSVTAAVRDTSKLTAAKGVQAAAVNVNDAAAVAELAASADLVISAVSPRNSGDAVKDATTFTEALIEMQRKTGKRLLMVGGGSSLQMPDGASVLDSTPDFILPEATGMRRAYAMMVSADIDFVVLAPSGDIGPGERTGQFRIGGRTMLTNASGGKGNISAEDFSVALLDEAEKPRHFRTVFTVGY